MRDPGYFDAHCHLQDAVFFDHRREIMEAMVSAGWSAATVNGTRESDWEEVATLARQYNWIRPAFGIHPWYADTVSRGWISHLESLLDEFRERASIGEVGLDRVGRSVDLATQKRVLVAQMELAAGRDLPMTFHCVRAWGHLLELCQSIAPSRRGFLLHAYGGPMEMVDSWVSLGAFFSFSPSFLDPRKTHRAQVFQSLPRGRILVETDAPSLPPPARREFVSWPPPPATADPRINHPLNLVPAGEELARTLSLDARELWQLVAINYGALFDSVVTATADPAEPPRPDGPKPGQGHR